MSEANPICEICVIRVICESLGSVATPNPRGYRPDGLCVICETFPEIILINLRDFTSYDICEKSAYLRNLRETFYGKEGWVDADAPRRVPTVDEREGIRIWRLVFLKCGEIDEKIGVEKYVENPVEKWMGRFSDICWRIKYGSCIIGWEMIAKYSRTKFWMVVSTGFSGFINC